MSVQNNFLTAFLTGLTQGVAKVVNLPFEPDWIIFYAVTGVNLVKFDNGPTIPAVRGSVMPLKGVKSFTVTPTIAPFLGSYIVYAVGTGFAPYLSAPSERVDYVDTFADISCGAAAVTQLINASPYGVKVHIAIPAGAAGPLRIGRSTVGASRGVLLQPGGQPYAFPYSADLYAYNGAASAVLASITWENAA